jgi:hypothetical protein
MPSRITLPKSSAYVAQGAPPQEPPYFKNIDAQVAAAAAPYLQDNQNGGVAAQSPAPIVPANAISKQSWDDIQSSLQNEVKKQQAYEKANSLLKMANQGNQNADNKDYDAEPHGFDASDKMSMLGALAVGGGVGAAEIGARAVQLFGKLSKEGSYTDILTKDFTDWFNRREARSNLIQEAIASHPTVYEVGKIGGNIAATIPVGEGIGTVVGGIAKGVGAIPEIGAGIDAAMAGIKQAATNGAAKSILNSKYLATALKLAKASGKGAMIGEMQYDPENNHFLNQGMTGALWGLAFPVAGSLVKNLVAPASQAIQDISQKFGISLPIQPSWEKFASYIPFTGYGEMIQNRAKQVAAAGEGIAAPIIKQGRQAMLQDLGQRETALTKQLSQEGLNDFDKEKIQQSIDAIKQQKDLVGTAAGYNEFLGGKLKQSLEQGKNEEAKLYAKVDEKMKDAPMVEMPKTTAIARSINQDQQDILSALRRPKLISISTNLLGEASPLRDKLINSGIDSPEKFSTIINDILNDKPVSAKDYAAAYPFLGNITEALKNSGLEGRKVDLREPIDQLSANVRLDYNAFRSNMQEIGSRISNSISPKENGNYKRLYGAMSQDLKDHIQANGNDEALGWFNQANKIHQDRVVPFYSAPLNAYRSDDFNADNFIGKFFKPDEVTKASNILQQMPKGENSAHLAAKAAIMNEAMTRANIDGAGFNPLKFIQQVKSLGETNNVVFSKAENAAFDGYQKFISTIKQISADALKPEIASGIAQKGETNFVTKKALIGASGLGGTLYGMAHGHPAISLAVAMSSWGFGRLMTTDAGRKLMIKLSNLGENVAADKIHPLINAASKLLLYGGVQAAVPIGRSM